MLRICLERIERLKWKRQFNQFSGFKSTDKRLNKDQNEIKDDKAVFVLRFNIRPKCVCVCA